jgi:RecA-family ATPase
MSLARAITNALGGDWNGDYGAVPGPGHSPADRSVTVRDDDTGRDVLVHSFAGDDWKSIKDGWRRAGLLPDLERKASSTPKPAAPAASAGRVVASYDYTDQARQLVYRIERVEPGRNGRRKDFRVRTPDVAGGWKAGLNGLEPLPYRLADLFNARPEESVYIVEGEKKADALCALGLMATCNPFGAGKWPAGFAAHFEGRHVVILPDNDTPGRAHAEDVAAKIGGAAASVIRVELPGLPEKGDVVDWLASGGTAEALAVLVDEARARSQASANAPPLPVINPASWQGLEPPVRRWLVEGWLAADSGAYLTGDGGVGKSLFTQQLCTCLAAGVSFLGLEVERVSALYLTCEDDAAELHRRQAAINASLGLDMSDLGGRLHLVSLKGELGNELAGFDAEGKLQLAPRFRDLEATAMQLGVGFVAIDNVAQTFNGNENVRSHVAAFCNLMDRLAMAIGGTVLFLGHPSKGGAEFSGSTGWEAHVRQRLFLDWADEGKGVSGDRDARVLRRSKANYSRKGEEVELRWHAGAFVLEGSAGASATPCEEQARRERAEEEVFLNCLRVRAVQKRPVSDSRNAANYAPKTFAAMPESGRMKLEAMAAAMERLIRQGAIERATRDNPLWRGEDRKPVLGLREVGP